MSLSITTPSTIRTTPIPPARPREETRLSGNRRGLREDRRPVSLLDEAHRRIRNNMQAIERRLRLGWEQAGQPSTEAMLTDLQDRVQSMAAFHRTLCRSGRFDQVDLAVYLRLVASALSAFMGGGADAPAPRSAGWAMNLPEGRLFWIDQGCDIHPPSRPAGSDLGNALRFLPEALRFTARRAICAVAVVIPPSVFRWRSPSSQPPGCGCERPVRPGETWVQIRADDAGLKVEVFMADRSLGLPRNFERTSQAALGPQIASVLDRAVRGNPPEGPAIPVIFRVNFVATRSETMRPSSAGLAIPTPQDFGGLSRASHSSPLPKTEPASRDGVGASRFSPPQESRQANAR